MTDQRIGVGVGVFVLHEDKLLIGRRKNITGSGTWALTGGKLEFGETWQECAKRETLEETNLGIDNVSLLGVLNVIRPEINYHFVIFFVKGHVLPDQTLENKEPEKCHEWKWTSFEELPSLDPLFFPLKQYLDEIGTNPFTSQP